MQPSIRSTPSFPHHVHVGKEDRVESGRALGIMELIGVIEREAAAPGAADLARVVEVVRLLHSTHSPTRPLTHPPPRATPPAQPTSPLRSAPDL
ncbi:MAG: hypothetical protein WBV59_01020 [Anaerolineae bacterium]